MSGEMPLTDRAIQVAVLRIGERLRAIAIEDTVPVRRGQLRKSIFVKSRGPLSMEVATNLAYARAVHDGRRALTIRPRAAKALRFKIGGAGKWVFARVARQKARPARPFFRDAIARFMANKDAELASVLADYPAAFVNDLAKTLRADGIHVH